MHFIHYFMLFIIIQSHICISQEARIGSKRLLPINKDYKQDHLKKTSALAYLDEIVDKGIGNSQKLKELINESDTKVDLVKRLCGLMVQSEEPKSPKSPKSPTLFKKQPKYNLEKVLALCDCHIIQQDKRHPILKSAFQELVANKKSKEGENYIYNFLILATLMGNGKRTRPQATEL